MLGETNSKKLAKIFHSDSSIKTRISGLAKDIECQVIEKIALQLLSPLKVMIQLMLPSCWYIFVLSDFLQFRRKCCFQIPRNDY